MNYALEVREKSEDTAHAPATRDPPGQPGAGPAALPNLYNTYLRKNINKALISSTSLACGSPCPPGTTPLVITRAQPLALQGGR